MDDAVAGDSGDGFSFNPPRSSPRFAVAKREEYGEGAGRNVLNSGLRPHHDELLTVMFARFSCVLSLTPSGIWQRQSETSLFCLTANHFNAPIIARMAPSILMIAITKSFLGHYTGA